MQHVQTILAKETQDINNKRVKDKRKIITQMSSQQKKHTED